MSRERLATLAIALSALALSVCAPPAARADHGTTFLDEGLARYMAIAHAYWGGPAPVCIENGINVIPVHAVLYDDPDPEVVARADQPGCHIWLDRSSWRDMRPTEACMTIVHEWGHLLGLGHSRDALDVMAEFPTVPPKRCVGLSRHTSRARARASGHRAPACAPRRKGARRHLWSCLRRSFR